MHKIGSFSVSVFAPFVSLSLPCNVLLTRVFLTFSIATVNLYFSRRLVTLVLLISHVNPEWGKEISTLIICIRFFGFANEKPVEKLVENQWEAKKQRKYQNNVRTRKKKHHRNTRCKLKFAYCWRVFIYAHSLWRRNNLGIML